MNDIKKIIKDYINQVEKNNIPITKAFLFGSYAKGSSSKYSDIDVCIVSPKFQGEYFEDSLKLKKIANKVDYRIEPVPFTQDDLNDKYSTLASEISKHGVIVV